MSPLADGGGGSGGDNTFQNAEHPHQEQLVDWDTLQIVERQDEEEGRMELIDEDQVKRPLIRENLNVIQKHQSQEADATFITSDGS